MGTQGICVSQMYMSLSCIGLDPTLCWKTSNPIKLANTCFSDPMTFKVPFHRLTLYDLIFSALSQKSFHHPFNTSALASLSVTSLSYLPYPPTPVYLYSFLQGPTFITALLYRWLNISLCPIPETGCPTVAKWHRAVTAVLLMSPSPHHLGKEGKTP